MNLVLVELLQDVDDEDANEVLDSRMNILEFVPLSNIGRAGATGGRSRRGTAELRFQTWALVLNTRKGQFLIWNNGSQCRISRILIPCHWKNRVTSDGGPLVALWSMRQQLILLDVSTGMACICPSPPQELVRSMKLHSIFSTCALGSSLDEFQLLVVYAESSPPRDRFLVTPVIFDSTTGMWSVKSRYHVTPLIGSDTYQEYGDSRWPGDCALAGGFLHVVFCEPSESWSSQWSLRYDLEGDGWSTERFWNTKWNKGQVNRNMELYYSTKTRRIHVEGLPGALADLQPPLEEGVARIRPRSDGVLAYAFFSWQGCLEIVYIHDIEAGTWCAHRYQRLRDLKMILKPKPLLCNGALHDVDHGKDSWSTLPTDLVQRVAQRLCTGRDIAALSMVCHNWRTSLRKEKCFTKLYEEPVLVFWNNKNDELCLFRSDKGWSRVISGKNFVHRAPLLVHGPLLISWEDKKLFITNISKKMFSRVRVMVPRAIGIIIRVGCISEQKLLVIFYGRSRASEVVTPAVLSFNASTHPKWQVGKFRRGLSYLTQAEPYFDTPYHSDDETGTRDAENVVLLGSYAYFMLEKRRSQVVFQYNWERDVWGFEEKVHAPHRDCWHDYCSYMYQFHIKSPLIQLNGRLAIVKPTLEIWYLPKPKVMNSDGVKCISKIPQETWEKLIQALDTSSDYTYMWDEYHSNARSTSPRIVVITPHRCATSVHMVCTIRNTLVAIIVWEFQLDLWGVIPLSNKEDRLWLSSKYFAVCLEHNSVVVKQLLRRSWFEFGILSCLPLQHWLGSGELRRFIQYPSIVTRAMEI